MAALKPKSVEELWQIVKDDIEILEEGQLGPLKYNEELDGDIHDFLIACILQ
jgi:hypothetical protein